MISFSSSIDSDKAITESVSITSQYWQSIKKVLASQVLAIGNSIDQYYLLTIENHRTVKYWDITTPIQAFRTLGQDSLSVFTVSIGKVLTLVTPQYYKSTKKVLAQYWFVKFSLVVQYCANEKPPIVISQYCKVLR